MNARVGRWTCPAARRLPWLVVLLLLVMGTGGCLPRVFDDDVQLTYEAADAPTTTGFGDDLRALVLARLSAVGIGADVSQADKRLSVVVGERRERLVDELVAWSGTLTVLEDASDAPYVPEEGSTRIARADGPATLRRSEGERADLAEIAYRTRDEPGHRVLVEALWETSDNGDPPLYRTRVVRSKPLAELADGIAVGRGEEGTLLLLVTPGSRAERDLAALRGRRDVVIARGDTSLGVPTWLPQGLQLSFGHGLAAYSRAAQEKQLLTTPRLPPLRPYTAERLPPNTTLALACLVLPLLLSLGWLGFVRRFDRAHPEPLWLIGATFALGAASTVPAGFLELYATRISPWTDARIVSMGGAPIALPFATLVLTLVVGLVEEGCKFLGAAFAVRRREFDEPVDGIVYGIVSSLGFAAAENFGYFAQSRLTAPLVIARCFMSVPAHMLFGAIWGYALGARLIDGKVRVWRFLVLSGFAHGLFDALLSTSGGAVFAVLLNTLLASVFVFLVRRALRHGVLDDLSRAIPHDERLLFRVGRPTLFVLSALALHILAFCIFLLGAWYQLSRHRPSSTFVVGSSIMVALLAVAAWGISATLPLDVAIDAYGVTFAGAARAWRKIHGFRVEGRHVELECEAGPLVIGPADEATLSELSGVLADHVGTNGQGERLSALGLR